MLDVLKIKKQLKGKNKFRILFGQGNGFSGSFSERFQATLDLRFTGIDDVDWFSGEVAQGIS
jgi:hypothetical protein